MTRTRGSASLAITTALTSFCALSGLAAPIAHASPHEGVRDAVIAKRSQSSCPPLTYLPQLEAVAQDYARDIAGSNQYGYPGIVSRHDFVADPTKFATQGLVNRTGGDIQNCAFKDFGVGMVRDDNAEMSTVSVALGVPPAPAPAPAANPAPAPANNPEKPTAKVFEFGTATVVADTDMYDKPDGLGQKIGTMLVGEEHPLMEPCRDDWCRLGTIELGGFPGLQNGTAWVYAKGYLTFS